MEPRYIRVELLQKQLGASIAKEIGTQLRDLKYNQGKLFVTLANYVVVQHMPNEEQQAIIQSILQEYGHD